MNLDGAVGVAGWGLQCALGSDVGAVAARLQAGDVGLSHDAALARMPGPSLAGRVDGPNLRPWLLRRKDKKLMARPSQLGLVAFGEALGDRALDRSRLALHVGVGREPPDQGQAQAALVAAAGPEGLDEALLAGPGRDLYPPLLPLQTLPNMALAHVSIHLGIHGENGAWAGGPAAGLTAVAEALHDLVEGRARWALAGAADSTVDRGSQRDRLRQGATSPPGEAGAALLLSREEGVAWLRLLPADPSAEVSPPLAPAAQIGDCGAAAGMVELVVAVHQAVATGQTLRVAVADPGHGPIAFEVVPSTTGGPASRG